MIRFQEPTVFDIKSPRIKLAVDWRVTPLIHGIRYQYSTRDKCLYTTDFKKSPLPDALKYITVPDVYYDIVYTGSKYYIIDAYDNSDKMLYERQTIYLTPIHSTSEVEVIRSLTVSGYTGILELLQMARQDWIHTAPLTTAYVLYDWRAKYPVIGGINQRLLKLQMQCMYIGRIERIDREKYAIQCVVQPPKQKQELHVSVSLGIGPELWNSLCTNEMGLLGSRVMLFSIHSLGICNQDYLVFGGVV